MKDHSLIQLTQKKNHSHSTKTRRKQTNEQINEKQVQRWTHLDELSDVLRFDGVRISSAELGTIHGQKLLESYL